MRCDTLLRVPAASIGALLLALLACRDESTGPDHPPPPPSTARRWSDPAAWGAAGVPTAGAAVVIPAGTRILLDISPPPLRSLLVEGELTFADTNLSLTAGWIMVHGTFRIGSANRPYRHKAVITLNGPSTDDIMAMGARVFGVMTGGTLELYGAPRTAWTTLDANATAGDTRITLAQTTDWRPGDRIVIASTDLNPLWVDERVITDVAGRTVTLAAPLSYNHWGTLQTVSGVTVDQRAEVALLNRHIVIQGEALSTTASGFGGHLMIMHHTQVRIAGVEFFNMGQTGQLARYPVHWHMAGSVQGHFLRNSVFWKTRNRCVTIHGTDGLLVEDNVCYDHLGHGYFLEDGAESRNRLERNLGLVTRIPPASQRLLPSDATPATFWITNPDNDFVGNRAAGSQGHGFWYALPESPTGLSTGAPDRPTRTPLGLFRDNTAHSNLQDGLHVDGGPLPDGTTTTTFYAPRQNPHAESPPVTASFQGFRAWKNSNRAVWLRGHELRLTGGQFSDNKIGATFAASMTFVEDAVFIGHTANTGGTQFPANFPIRGFEFYDGTVGARRVTFINYPSDGRIRSAIGFNRQNAFDLSPYNAVEQLTFVNANRVYIENPHPLRDGDKAAVFLDADGSVTGTAGSVVAAVNPLHVTPACAFRSEWNAYVCLERFIRLQVRGINGEVIGPALVRRTDGAEMTYVGSGNNPVSISVSLPIARAYQVTPGGSPPLSPRFVATGMQPGEWIRVTVPYPGSTVRITRDYSPTNLLLPAKDLAELEASSGDRFYRDPATGLLHLKLVAQAGRDYAVLHVSP
jgi:cell migration-inducing and hyaluronan-binding protein